MWRLAIAIFFFSFFLPVFKLRSHHSKGEESLRTRYCWRYSFIVFQTNAFSPCLLSFHEILNVEWELKRISFPQSPVRPTASNAYGTFGIKVPPQQSTTHPDADGRTIGQNGGWTRAFRVDYLHFLFCNTIRVFHFAVVRLNLFRFAGSK